MAKEPDKNKQDLWDQAKVVNEVEHRFGRLGFAYNPLSAGWFKDVDQKRLPAVTVLWLKIFLRLFIGLCFGLSILTLSSIQMTAFSIIVGQEGLRHISKAYNGLNDSYLDQGMVILTL